MVGPQRLMVGPVPQCSYATEDKYCTLGVYVIVEKSTIPLRKYAVWWEIEMTCPPLNDLFRQILA